MMTVRRGLLLLVAGAALTAVLGGLARLGLAVGFGPAVADQHGPFFVLGVFGTVISLDRAVALGRSWALAAPIVSIAGALALLLRLSFAPGLFVVAVALTLVVNAAIIRRQSAAFTWLMLLGSITLLEGTFAWARGASVFDVTPGWMAFFVLTIVSERLELSRLAPTPTWAARALVVVSLVLALASMLGLRVVMGATLVLLGLWQLRFDLARRTVKLPGLPRFTALGVLAGAAWLIVTGALLVHTPPIPAGPLADAGLHALFVGFVLSMVFAHAPIILPAVARVSVPFHAALFVPLVALHAALVARVAGDLLAVHPLRVAGAVTNVLSLVLFAVSVIITSRRPAASVLRPEPSMP
ncbi:MAG: hypothetical protein GQE15_21655 [Archangiaceae bacterium]|nr:hypothetical protein [Archangiaceae bacterium]